MTAEINEVEMGILERMRRAKDYSDITVEKRGGKFTRILVEESELLVEKKK